MYCLCSDIHLCLKCRNQWCDHSPYTLSPIEELSIAEKITKIIKEATQ